MRPPRWVRALLDAGDLEAVRQAIATAEARTSGEIRVHLDAACPGDPLARAIQVFEGLGMTGTAERNGVLVYVAIQDRKLSVVGDRAIHARAPADHWRALADRLAADLAAGRARAGLVAAVEAVGQTLAHHFPRRPDDRNELGDEVSLGPEA
jgi:uncharacterized membrane protein